MEKITQSKLHSKLFSAERSGFTLLELIIVIGIVAILGTVAVLVLNPAQIFMQTRDANRVSDLRSINQAMVYYQAVGGSSFGSANTVYVSLPSAQANCSDLGLPALGGGWSYACEPAASYRNTNGTGWIPVDFSAISGTVGSLFSSLPIDPTNTVSGDFYYTYIVGSWGLSATMESTKYIAQTAGYDGGVVDGRYETGNDLALNSNISAGGGGGGNCTTGNQTFVYTGAQQTLVIGTGCTTITVDAVGASGSNAFWGRSGGRGGRSQGSVTVTPGETVYIYVGGMGLKAGDPGAPGGYNGGGIGGGWSTGGGASDVRRGGTALTDRVIVAGGGGAAGSQVDGGAGGGTTGGSAIFETHGSTGGTQIDGGSGSGGGTSGSLGQGGSWGVSPNAFGGGGGYYGGGAVGNDGGWAGYGGGAGGSSLVPVSGSTTSGYGSLNSDGSVYISW